MNKNIFLLWLQGWDKAPWLQNEVLKSWEINNPDWNIHLIDFKNLKNYVNDIDYIYDANKKISPQAKSDIIRLSLLKNYGGVWADSTLLCMQPLDHWINEATKPNGIWMYHGHGAQLDSNLGPSSWFIISEKNSYIINKWKKVSDNYWLKLNKAKDYFWMDLLFKELLIKDNKFKSEWLKTPFLYCEEVGSSHTLSHMNFKMHKNNSFLKKVLEVKPPYVLKLSSNFDKTFPNLNSRKFKFSNVFFALKMSKRGYCYKHQYKKPFAIKSPYKSIYKKIINKFINIFF
tara:strand:+ start:146 stop:1006 length:861 start_codon:yes stop_codon:yes gene_type:complete